MCSPRFFVINICYGIKEKTISKINWPAFKRSFTLILNYQDSLAPVRKRDQTFFTIKSDRETCEKKRKSHFIEINDIHKLMSELEKSFIISNFLFEKL